MTTLQDDINLFCDSCFDLVQKIAYFQALEKNWQELHNWSQKRNAYFFSDLNIILIENIFSHIRRITDGEKSCGKTNLSSQYLAKQFTNLELINHRLVGFRNKIEDHTNQRIAHCDLGSLRNVGTQPELFTDMDLSNFLSDLQEFVNILKGEVYPLDSPHAEGDIAYITRALKNDYSLENSHAVLVTASG